MKTTQEFFSHLTIDELLINNELGYTKEENLLFDLGLNCTFFDNEKEYELEKVEFKKWIKHRGMSAVIKLQTINGRIAIISR